MSLWENRYLTPFVRLMNYEAVFDELLSPIESSFKSRVEVEGQALILHLTQEPVRRRRRPEHGPGTLQGSIAGFASDGRAFSEK